MAKIVVVNPPRRRRRRVKRVRPAARRKRRMSAKARRAAIRNLKLARKSIGHKTVHRRRRRRLKKAIAKTHRRRRSRRKSLASFVNPFAGTLAMMGNPGGRKHRRKKRTKSMARKRRHHKRSRALSNPFTTSALLSAPRQLVSTENIMEAAGVAAGFVLPGVVMNYLPATWKSTTMTYYVSKVGTVALLSVAGRLVSPRVAKFVLVGGTVSILLDLYAEFVQGKMPVTAAPAATAGGTQAFYGDLNAWYGERG